MDEKLQVVQTANISTDSFHIGFLKQEASKLNQTISLPDGWFSGLPALSTSDSAVLIQVMITQ